MHVAPPPIRLPEALNPVEVIAADPPANAPGPARFGSQGSGASSLSVWHLRLNLLAGHRLTAAGALHPRLAGRVVSLQVRAGRRWRSVAWVRTGAAGRFRLRYAPHWIGSRAVRVRFAGDRTVHGARRRLGRLNVFRLAGASWYGGGGSLACGGTLAGDTLGVANRTLPCGTLVTLRYGTHTVRVPVIDRGPFVAGRDFDLTEATKRALHFPSTGAVWSTR
jgi:peptidoglycan lytic transglycosylase